MRTDWTTDVKGTGRYAEVNGIKLYYETHGAGPTLILLHGGLMSGEMFGPVLPQLAERHQVIAVDLQGHGRTADIDRPIDARLIDVPDPEAAIRMERGLHEPFPHLHEQLPCPLPGSLWPIPPSMVLSYGGVYALCYLPFEILHAPPPCLRASEALALKDPPLVNGDQASTYPSTEASVLK